MLGNRAKTKGGEKGKGKDLGVMKKKRREKSEPTRNAILKTVEKSGGYSGSEGPMDQRRMQKFDLMCVKERNSQLVKRKNMGNKLKQAKPIGRG